MHCFLELLSIDQTNWICSNDKLYSRGFTELWILSPFEWGLCMILLTIDCYIVSRGQIMQSSSDIVDFYLFDDGPVDMQIWQEITVT